MEMIDTSSKKNGASGKQVAQEIPIEDEKSAQEYYEAFKFDEQVRYFTDFLQARMQPQNQLMLDSLQESTAFTFYTQGR